MPKKHTLYIEEEHEFTVVGISTTLKEYKLCFHLNKNLNIDLKKIEDFCFGKTKDNKLYFPLFYFNKVSSLPKISLVKNKIADSILFPVFRQVDYIMILHKVLTYNELNDYLQGIKSIQNVITAFPMKTENIKNFKFFLSDLEIHLLESEEKEK